MKKRETDPRPDEATPPRPTPPGTDEAPGPGSDAPDPRAGFAREVGDLDDPDVEHEGALPGRAGGGLAGG